MQLRKGLSEESLCKTEGIQGFISVSHQKDRNKTDLTAKSVIINNWNLTNQITLRFCKVFWNLVSLIENELRKAQITIRETGKCGVSLNSKN